MKLLVKTAWLMMIVTLSSFDWIFGFIAIGIWLTIKLYDLLLIAEYKEMAEIDAYIAESELRVHLLKQQAKDERFKKFIQQELEIQKKYE